MLTRRRMVALSAATALAHPLMTRGVQAQGLAEPFRAAGRAVCRGRGERGLRAQSGGPAVGDLGPAGGDREQAGRRRQYRGRGRGPFRSRRLDHADRIVSARGGALPLPRAGLRSDRRPRAGHPHRAHPQYHGGAELLARPLGQRIHRPCQGEQGQGHLRVVGRRHLDPSLGRAVQAHGRHRDDARALSRRRARACRPHSRAGRPHVQRDVVGASAGARRPDARAGGDHRPTRAGRGGISHARRGRAARIRSGRLVRLLRARPGRRRRSPPRFIAIPSPRSPIPGCADGWKISASSWSARPRPSLRPFSRPKWTSGDRSSRRRASASANERDR